MIMYPGLPRPMIGMDFVNVVRTKPIPIMKPRPTFGDHADLAVS